MSIRVQSLPMTTFWLILVLLLAVAAVGLLVYWLVVITEGVYLGQRLVVWLYDITANRYDRIKQFDEGAEEFFVIRPLRGHLARNSTNPAPWILDVATGTGRVPYHLLAEPTFHGRVVGLDASARMLDIARAKVAPYGGRVALIRQTALALPFADSCFDAVTCLEALEFLPDAETAVCEMARVLRPGGTLMITRRCGWEAKTFIGRHLSAEAFAAMLQRLGFVEIEEQAWQVEYDLVWARKKKDEG